MRTPSLHRQVKGGMRITMYNWVPDEAVDAVVDFMRLFAKRHQSAAPHDEV